MKILFIFALSFLIVFAKDDPEEFVPSNEWKTVREGQTIPAGLHVRLNLQTGEREAKFLEKNEEKSTQNLVPVASEPNQEEISRKKLEEIFSRLDLTGDDVETNETHEDQIRQKFRPYDELKKEFESLNLKVETDQEILEKLIENFNEKTNNEDRKTILTDLEYFLHQFDNAIFFSDRNGLKILLDAFRTSTDNDVRRSICLALAAAFQGNPKVQEKAVKSDFVKELIDLIVSEHDEQIQIRLFYPLSTLLRNFPPAQREFLEKNGVESMFYFLSNNRSSPRLINRLLTLMTDLLVEKETIDEEKTKIYEGIQFGNRLIELGWCSFLSDRIKSLEIDEFESIDKIIQAFVPVKGICAIDFLLLEKIRDFYTKGQQSEESISIDFLNNIENLLDWHRKRSLDDL